MEYLSKAASLAPLLVFFLSTIVCLHVFYSLRYEIRELFRIRSWVRYALSVWLQVLAVHIIFLLWAITNIVNVWHLR